MGLVHFQYQVSCRARRLASLNRFGRRDNGFTLTELVIAMVVLGVLTSTAVPSFLGSRNNSYDKEAQSSIEVVLRAAKFHYQSQGDFSDGSSAQCGDSTGLAADLQKLEPNVDVVASSVPSTNARIISVQAVQTWSSNAELLGCQGFYAVALSSSGSCWAARIILEGKYLASGNVSPVVVNTQTNTSNNAVTTWSALAVNGHAFGVLKPQTSAADGDDTNGLVALKNACKAKTQSTGVATTSSNYIAPSQFYATWRDVTSGGTESSSSSSSSSSAESCITTNTCALGAIGPGGGKVFYVQASGGTFTSTGSACNTTCKYLEMAPRTWNSGASDPLIAWCNITNVPASATLNGIGVGYANRVAIEAVCASGANNSAGAYSGGGMTDWYLPAWQELTTMIGYNRTAGNIPAGSPYEFTSNIHYFSSNTGAASGSATCTVANTGSNTGCSKLTAYFVRPVRAFG